MTSEPLKLSCQARNLGNLSGPSNGRAPNARPDLPKLLLCELDCSSLPLHFYQSHSHSNGGLDGGSGTDGRDRTLGAWPRVPETGGKLGLFMLSLLPVTLSNVSQLLGEDERWVLFRDKGPVTQLNCL